MREERQNACIIIHKVVQVVFVTLRTLTPCVQQLFVAWGKCNDSNNKKANAIQKPNVSIPMQRDLKFDPSIFHSFESSSHEA